MPRASKVDPVYHGLWLQIVRMELPPGSVLHLHDIARTYGVSPTPVRAALLRLQQVGFVQIYPQSRTVVTHIALPQLHEEHFLRLALETSVTHSLAQGCCEDALVQARSAILMQEDAVRAGNDDAVRLYGGLYHQTLFEAAGQASLHSVLRDRSGHLARLEWLDDRGGFDHDILDAHDGIVAAIAKGQGDCAVARMRRHINPVIGRIDDLKDRYPAYFAP